MVVGGCSGSEQREVAAEEESAEAACAKRWRDLRHWCKQGFANQTSRSDFRCLSARVTFEKQCLLHN